ncbi:hypothetical protein Q9233_017123 [Columba guinea]|nr:hypothetical protein Q9233_017123 [Columba guinea]
MQVEAGDIKVIDVVGVPNAQDRLEEPLEIEELIRRFRANLVISAPESFEEEEWAEISIGALRFQVVGPCSRCQIICIDQQSGERNKEFLQSLSAARGKKVSTELQKSCIEG